VTEKVWAPSLAASILAIAATGFLAGLVLGLMMFSHR